MSLKKKKNWCNLVQYHVGYHNVAVRRFRRFKYLAVEEKAEEEGVKKKTTKGT